MFKDNLCFDPTHQRQEISFKTYDLEVLWKKSNENWSFKKIKEGFLVRSPEEWLVDLSDPYKILFYDGIIVNLAYFNFLKDLISRGDFGKFVQDAIKKYHFNGLESQLLEGPGIETEIRLAGSDNRIKDFKKVLYSEVEQNSLWQCYLEKAKNFLGPSREIVSSKVSIHDSSLEVKSFFFSLMDFYKPFQFFNRNPFNPVFIPNLFKDMPQADVYLFVPWGCFHYISSFIDKENINKIMFWEVHADPYQTHMNKYLAKDLKGKEVMMIDNSYSGNTLKQLAELVKKEGGIPKRFAIYPKSRLAIENSDYVLFGDRILESTEIDINNPDWLRLTYKKVFSKK